MEENEKINFTILSKWISLCAMRGSGKSGMQWYLVMAEKHKFYKVFCISPTNVTNGFYDDFIKKENIFSKWSDEWVQE